MNGGIDDVTTEEIEATLLLEAIYQRHGYDFRNYARASILRRIRRRVRLEGLERISDLQKGVLYDAGMFERLLLDFSISVTEMFRDPAFFATLRSEVIPVLRTYPSVRIWHAGCASGEEVYSMAIVLREEGLYDRAQIYATDLNGAALKRARDGVLPIERIREYTLNYQKAGGKESFGDYYTARYGFASIDKALRERIVFASHNLATDGVFGEMHLVVCRNVLIYFDRELQRRVLSLFAETLCHRGYLCIGTKESLRHSARPEIFEPVAPTVGIYRKRAPGPHSALPWKEDPARAEPVT